MAPAATLEKPRQKENASVRAYLAGTLKAIRHGDYYEAKHDLNNVLMHLMGNKRLDEHIYERIRDTMERFERKVHNKLGMTEFDEYVHQAKLDFKKIVGKHTGKLAYAGVSIVALLSAIGLLGAKQVTANAVIASDSAVLAIFLMVVAVYFYIEWPRKGR